MECKELYIRYARMLAVGGFGETELRRLQEGNVMIVGCGALGSLAAMYLAGAGIGKIGIADFDTIDISNLHRQLFYQTNDAGLKKAEILAGKMQQLNPEVTVETYSELVNEKNASGIFHGYDFIIDATDNSSSKFMIERICISIGKPFSTGGVAEFRGQVMSWEPGHTRFGDIFPAPSDREEMAPCATLGVMGPAAGIVASVQASEAIKHLSGIGKMLYDKVFIFDMNEGIAGVMNIG